MSAPVLQNDESVTVLVKGILSDCQDLFERQVELFKSEVRTDITKAREAATALSLGLGLAYLGVMLLCFMGVHLLAWGFDLPLWAAFGLAGAVLLSVGAIAYVIGRHKLATLNPVPEQTVQSMKENVRCLKNPK